MRLNELLPKLRERGIGKVGTWELKGRRGITLGDPTKYFPYRVGPQYPVDTTEEPNPPLTVEEVAAIERRFQINLSS